MLNSEQCGLLIVDIQGKLARIVHDSEGLITRTRKLIHCCQLLSLPIVILEQNPKGLGRTIGELAELLTDVPLFEKHHFNGLEESDVQQALSQQQKSQWLVVGIEAHICVLQTAMGLKSKQYNPVVVTDCIASRDPNNRDLAIANLRQKGVAVTSLEMCVYELMKSSQHPEFKQILKVIKD